MNNRLDEVQLFDYMLNIIRLYIPHLLLSQQLRVHHLDLDGNQSERLKCQTPSVSVVVLCTQTGEQLKKFQNSFTN